MSKQKPRSDDVIQNFIDMKNVKKQRVCMNCFHAKVVGKNIDGQEILDCNQANWPRLYTLPVVMLGNSDGVNHKGKCKDWESLE